MCNLCAGHVYLQNVPTSNHGVLGNIQVVVVPSRNNRVDHTSAGNNSAYHSNPVDSRNFSNHNSGQDIANINSRLVSLRSPPSTSSNIDHSIHAVNNSYLSNSQNNVPLSDSRHISNLEQSFSDVTLNDSTPNNSRSVPQISVPPVDANNLNNPNTSNKPNRSNVNAIRFVDSSKRGGANPNASNSFLDLGNAREISNNSQNVSNNSFGGPQPFNNANLSGESMNSSFDRSWAEAEEFVPRSYAAPTWAEVASSNVPQVHSTNISYLNLVNYVYAILRTTCYQFLNRLPKLKL